MDPSVSTTVLIILGSAFGVIFATLTTQMFILMRVQHRDSIETRKAIAEAGAETHKAFVETHKAIAESNVETHKAIAEANAEIRALGREFAEHKRVTEENHQAAQEQFRYIGESLVNIRERLARLEGDSAPPGGSPDGGEPG